MPSAYDWDRTYSSNTIQQLYSGETIWNVVVNADSEIVFYRYSSDYLSKNNYPPDYDKEEYPNAPLLQFGADAYNQEIIFKNDGTKVN